MKLADEIYNGLKQLVYGETDKYVAYNVNIADPDFPKEEKSIKRYFRDSVLAAFSSLFGVRAYPKLKFTDSSCVAKIYGMVFDISLAKSDGYYDLVMIRRR